MTDYKQRIRDRADILSVELSTEQLYAINQKVNDKISNGLHEFDALDYAYFYIKNNYEH